MAGDWLKMDHDIRDKPEVIAMSITLKVDPDLIVGKLHRVWSWFDSQTVDGNAPGVTPEFIDQRAALDGFASALENVGWLSIRNNGISIPNFDRRFGKSAKTRALTNARVKRSRNASTVTKPLPEKRREEKKDKPPVVPPSGFARFWKLWPKHDRKRDRDLCEKLWIKRELEPITGTVIDGLDRWISSDEWAKNSGEFIPQPHTWLNKKRWESEPKPSNDVLNSCGPIDQNDPRLYDV